LPGELLARDLAGAGNVLENGLNLVRQPLQRLEVVPEDLDPDVGADPRDHLVHPHLDRLGQDRVDPRDVLDLGLDRGRPAPAASSRASTRSAA
jgi:hypothetical protein